MRFAFISLTFLVACVGKAPPGGDDDDTPGPDAPPAATGQPVTGKVMDYFVAATPLANAMVVTDGITPALMASSITDGSYTIDNVPVGSALYLSATRTMYRPTRNIALNVADAPVMQDIYLMSIADVLRNYTNDGKTPTVGRAFVIAELQRNNGTPAAGVPLTDVKLLDANNQPVAGVIGPYSIGPLGDVQMPPQPLVTELFNGKVKVAFLDVPPGTFKVDMTVLNGQGQPQVITSTMTTVADGATLHKVGGMGMMGGGMVTNPKFTTDIQPRLQKAANNGIGCANCHTAGGPGAVMIIDGPAQATLDALKAKLGLIDLVTPANSLLLTKPLYELAPPQNHPNATFLDLNNEDYKMIMLWITQGALP